MLIKGERTKMPLPPQLKITISSPFPSNPHFSLPSSPSFLFLSKIPLKKSLTSIEILAKQPSSNLFIIISSTHIHPLIIIWGKKIRFFSPHFATVLAPPSSSILTSFYASKSCYLVGLSSSSCYLPFPPFI